MKGLDSSDSTNKPSLCVDEVMSTSWPAIPRQALYESTMALQII